MAIPPGESLAPISNPLMSPPIGAPIQPETRPRIWRPSTFPAIFSSRTALAVVKALSEKHLRRYVTDFPSPRLQGNPNVLALPHLGASTEEAEENCAYMVVDQLRQFLEEGTIANSVNFPSVDMARESPHRIAIANSNVPNMLGQISTTKCRWSG